MASKAILLFAICHGALAAGLAPQCAAADETPPSIYTYRGADRQQVLEAGAKKEGAVTWYTTHASRVLDTLKSAFEKQYPFVKVDVYRGSSNSLNAKAIQEHQGNRQAFDVTDPTPPSLLAFKHYGILAPFYSPAIDLVGKDMKEEASANTAYWILERESYVGFAYNTKLLPPSDVPTTMADLANPSLKGKMAVSGETTGKRWIGAAEIAVGKDKADAFFSAMSKQNVQLQGVSGRALLNLVAKGEIQASFTIYQAHVDAVVKDGASVQWAPLAPVTANAASVGVALKAPHPHAAVLLADFLLGPEGQKILTKAGFGGPGRDPSFKRWYPEAGLTFEGYAAAFKTWVRKFDSVFRGRF